MKQALSRLLLILLGSLCGTIQAQGYPSSPSNWSLPVGGYRDNGIHFGYKSIYNTADPNDDINSETWGLRDMNGDRLPDLVVTASTNSVNQHVIGFSPSSNPYWKVYYNNGSGFAASSSTWLLPDGGLRENGIHLGYTSLRKVALSTEDDASESWDLFDINGDDRPDLVVTAQTDSSTGQVMGYSPGSNPYWRVFINIGLSFATNAILWPVPVGGLRDGGVHYGYRDVAGTALPTDDNGSETWSLVDINRDSLVDLVVTAQTDAALAQVTSYSPGTNPHWRVFFNNGSGFDSSPTNWPLPVGGKRQGGNHYGYVNLNGVALSTDDSGSETWNTTDINGDRAPDLIVCAQTDAATARVMGYSPGNNPYWRVFYNITTGFDSSPTTWLMPVGGKRQGGIHYGYINLSGTALATDDNGSESWELGDLHLGDRLPDLITTAETDAASGRVIGYNPGNNPAWRIHANYGSLFGGNYFPWDLPLGGTRASNFHHGYVALNGIALGTDDPTSQTWSARDMDGDFRPDLIVTAETNSSSEVMSFSPGSNPYWNVYIAEPLVGTAPPVARALRLSPNPASSTLRIDFPDLERGSPYTVLSLSGQTLRQGQVDGPTTTLDIHDFPDGMYFVRVGEGQAHIGKFVKQ